MAEIDSLGTNFYYSGVQNASNEAIKRNTRKEETQKAGATRRTKFSELLKAETEVKPQFVAEGLPPEVKAMSIDDAAVYLADAVSNAGNDFSDAQTQENLDKFKQAVSQFIRFVIENNFQIDTKRKKNRLGKDMIVPSQSNFFSNYTIPPHRVDPRVSVKVLNDKLDALARETLSNQMNNPKILAQVNELKGLIVDLMSS